MATPQSIAVKDFLGTNTNVIIGMINGSSKGGSTPEYNDEKKTELKTKFESHRLTTFFKKTLELFEIVHKNTKESHEKLPPIWFTTNSFNEIMQPVNFEGPADISTHLYTVTDSYMYASHQIIRRWDSAMICAILGSKKPWKSKSNTKKNETLIDSSLASAADVEYLKKRGAISQYGNKSTEYVRWVAPYTTSSGQNAFIFISGDQSFLNGSVDLIPQFKVLTSYKLKKQDSNNSSIELNDEADILSDPKNLELVGTEIETMRLVSAAVVVHDYLCYLKNKEGVEELIEIDYSTEEKFKSVPITDVIAMYSKIKKYLTILNAYSLIQ
jgi:hypothetical protein